ncbi:MAG TPA: enoyl-CoA hydratase [Aliidongia sp.]|nr:enoyl-CoA hydratase [Aliidongia sp.]
MRSRASAPAASSELEEHPMDKILAAVDGAVATITFNNPERHNAVSLDMWKAVLAALDRFAADPAVRVLVVTGAGGKSFVSGADISKFEDERASEAAVAEYDEATESVYKTLLAYAKPTIAKIRGYCIGGGMNLAICCDLRISNEAARFAVPAAKLGLGYGMTRVKRVLDIVGPQFAKEIFFTARQFDAAEAKVMGLVNRVVPDGELDAFVADYAATIGGNAPLTVHSIKRIIGEALKDPDARDLALCDRLVKACFESEDYKEGRRAFMEKRKPAFTGR